jgi:hypothetical protein
METIPEMSAQEIFDKVVEHLAKQGKRARIAVSPGDFRCKYRTPDGLKCAVGVLIPDELYDPEMDSGIVDILYILKQGKFPQLNLLIRHMYLLAALQSIHDNEDNWAYPWKMPEELEACGNNFGLDTSSISQFFPFYKREGR